MLLKNVTRITIGIVFVLLMVAVFQLQIQSAVAAPPQLPNNSCADCHRKLIFTSEKQREFVDIRIKHLESGISCSIVCHEDKLNKSTASTYAMWSVSTHALFNVTCEKCHGGNPVITSKEGAHSGLSNISIARENTPETCGKCHDPELKEFKDSLHFKKLESGQEGPAPACITCHQAHSVRVLTASEIEDFCSNCHNRITGIDPSVPKKAEKALTSVNELQVGLSKARSAIITAKASGRNTAEAEADLDAAREILRHIPSVWHRFNLTYFDTEVQEGITDTQNAEKALTEEPSPTAPAKSPGFEGFMLLAGALAVYFLKRR